MAATTTTTPASRSPAYRIGAATLMLAIAVILGALAFEYIGGYAPCPLCLEQRYAYYVAIPLLFIALVLVSADHPSPAAMLFAVVAAAFLANAAYAGYHAGAEWKLWAGPDTCAPAGNTLGTSAGGLLKELEKTTVVRCDEAALRILGLSLAGWNVIACLLLAAGSARAAVEAWHSRSFAR